MKTSLVSKILSASCLVLGLPFSVSAATTTAQALASFDKLVGDYNLITINDANLSKVTETEGMIAVGGNLTISEQTINIATKATFADAAGYASASMYVNGKFTTTSTEKDGIKLEHGYASFGSVKNSSASKWSSSNRELTIGKAAVFSEANSYSAKSWTSPFSSSLSNHWDFNALQNDFVSISNTLKSASVTGNIAVGNNQALTLSPIAAGQHGAIIFDLDMSKMTTDKWGNLYYNNKSFSQIQFDIPTGDNYVVNVLNLNSSNSTLFKNINFNDNADDYDRLLWNFVSSCSTNSLTIATNNNFFGSILAPTYNLVGGSLLDGQIVANGYTACYNGELHYSNFDDTVPSYDELPQTPEASTYGLFGAAACLALVAVRRFRKQKR